MAADLQARLATAASFILQSPPGEVNDVFNDVRAIVGDDDALESGILPALEKYNIEQLIVAALPDKQQLLICQAGAVSSPSSSEPQRFIDPSTGKAWIFDHLRLSASDPLDTHVDAECEAFRVELEKHAREYAKEHFGNEGVGKVFTTAQRQLKRPSPPLSSPPAAAAAAAAAGAQQETTEAPAEPVGAPPQSTDTEALVQEKARLDAEDPTLEETPAKVDVDNAAAENVEPAAGESAVAIQTESGEEQREHSAGEAGDTKMQSAAATPAPADGAEDAPAGDTAMDVTASAADEPAQPGPQEQQQEETVEPVEKRFSLYFVGNKYNPANYWTGRWRSSYTLDLTSPTPSLTGQVQLNVHFFEQGNVQLATTHTPSISLGSAASGNASPAEIARSALKAISKVEEEYQLELNEAYREMAEKTFRSLRRALPITKQKMDWGKVANYKLGRDLSGAQR